MIYGVTGATKFYQKYNKGKIIWYVELVPGFEGAENIFFRPLSEFNRSSSQYRKLSTDSHHIFPIPMQLSCYVLLLLTIFS